MDSGSQSLDHGGSWVSFSELRLDLASVHGAHMLRVSAFCQGLICFCVPAHLCDAGLGLQVNMTGSGFLMTDSPPCGDLELEAAEREELNLGGAGVDAGASCLNTRAGVPHLQNEGNPDFVGLLWASKAPMHACPWPWARCVAPAVC